LDIIRALKGTKKMAIPKRLTPIDKQTAERTIVRHTKAGTGEWEGARFASDFVYEYRKGYRLLRPPLGPWGSWETGMVSM
jgi:hypothetical protein